MKKKNFYKHTWVARLILYLLFFLVIGQSAIAQNDVSEKITIQGRVFEDHEPPVSLPGVSVIVKNSTNAVVSDANGYFKIIANKGDVLIFSYIGFHPFEFVVARETSNLNVSLKEDATALQEVVVAGMTEERKLNIISSISTLDLSTNLENKPILSLSHALQGGISGLSAMQSSGLPGADAAEIKIRGVATLKGVSNPLILVDGIPIGDMNNIDPTTIENVTVLKDAAAAAIYGARAANGVIVIKTKRGKAGRVITSYNGYYGVQKATYLPEFIDAATYMEMVNAAYANIGGNPIYGNEAIAATRAGTDPINYPNTDWTKTIYKDGAIQSHSVSVSGGSDIARFALTVNYQDQKGLINNTNFNRLNIRANTSVNLAENLTVKMDFNSYRRERKEAMYRADEYSAKILDLMFSTPPNIVGKYPMKEGKDIVYYGNRIEMRNPVALIERGGYMENLEDNVSINIQPQWNIMKNLTLRGQYSYRVSSMAKNEKRKSYNFFDYNSDAMIYTWNAINTAKKDRSSYYYLGGILDYLLEIDKHYLFAIAGYNQELTNEGDFDQYSLRSFYSKANYTFDRRYLIEFTIRADGSSRFGDGHKYGYFPSVAAGWNLHNEKFMSSLTYLDNLKIRGSYGLLGNENIGLYKYQTLVDASNGNETVYGNPNITWETVHMFNIGADIGLFKDFTLSFDYYNKITKDMIILPPLSLIGGSDSQYINTGEVRNRGWELDINYVRKFKDFGFNIHAGLSQNKNKILSLFGQPYDEGSIIQKVGYPINSDYIYETKGLLQESDFVGKDSNGKWIPKNGVAIFDGQQPGDIHYVDQDNNGSITPEDRVVKGNREPDINYFTNLTFDYKKWGLEILLQGVSGVDAYYSDTYRNGLAIEGDGSTPITVQTDYWTPQNMNARYPRVLPMSSYGNNHHISDFWKFNADFCRVKYIQLGYTFDQMSLRKFGVSKIRIYVNAQNPFTFSKENLIDPEGKGSVTSYPLLKTYSMGVSLNF